MQMQIITLDNEDPLHRFAESAFVQNFIEPLVQFH